MALSLEFVLAIVIPHWPVAKIVVIGGVFAATLAILIEVAHFFNLAFDAVGVMLDSLGDLIGNIFAFVTLVCWQWSEFWSRFFKRHNPRKRCLCGSGKYFSKCHGKANFV